MAITRTKPRTPGRPAARLTDSDARYRLMAENSPDMIFVVGRSGLVEYVNRASARSVGRSPSAVVGRKVSQLFPPEIAHRQWRNLRRVFATGRPLSLENTSIFRGRTLWLNTWLVPVRERGGAVISVMGISRDITGRKQAERSQRESEEKYRGLVEATDTGYVILDQHGLVKDANAEYVRLTGRRRLEQVIGRPVTEWTAPYDRTRNRIEVERCMRRGSVRMLEVDYVHRDGTVIPVEINATVVRSATGPLIVTLCRDITQRKRTERDLRENLAKYRLLFNSINDSIWIHRIGRREPGRFVEVNDIACRRLGYTREEMLRMSVADIDAPEQVARIRETFNRIQRTGQMVFEADHLTKTGRRISMELNVSRISYHGRDAHFVVGRDITERKRAERALRESEAKYRALFDQASDGIMFMSADGSQVMVNRSFARMHGYDSPAQMERLRLADLDTPDSAKLASERLRRMLAGETLSFEVEHFRRDGRTFPLQVNCRAIRIGDQTYFLGFHRDITDVKRSQDALRASEDQLRTLVENQGEGIGIIDTKDRFTFTNPAAEAIFGVNPGALVGKTLRRFLAKSQHAEVRKQTALRRSGIRSTYELTIRKRRGQQRRILVTGTPRTDDRGRFIGTFAIFRDITELRRIDQALRQSEEALRKFIDQSAEGIAILDERGQVAEWNQAQQRIYGIGRDRTMGRYFWDLQYLLTPRRQRTRGQRGHYRRLVLQALRTGRSPMFDAPLFVTVIAPDGTVRITEQRAFPIRTDHGYRIGAVTMDVTEQRRLEQQILEISDQVQRQVGHDLHDGLGQLLTVMGLRLSALEHDQAARRTIGRRELTALSDLVKQAMTQAIGLSRGLAPMGLETSGIAPALAELARSTSAVAGIPCRALLDEGIRIGDVTVATHVYRIAQEAVNNAVKHARATKLEIGLKRERNAIRLCVSDDGIGIDKRRSRPAGMGLKIMQYRARMIGATLETRPNPAGGTVVCCRFNVTAAPPATATKER